MYRLTIQSDDPQVIVAALEREIAALTATPVEPLTLADALRNHMHEKRLSRAQMAERVGISYPFLSELLKSHKSPSVTTLGKIRDAGVDIALVTF